MTRQLPHPMSDSHSSARREAADLPLMLRRGAIRISLLITGMIAFLIGGCPSTPDNGGSSPITAIITASSTRGTPPLRVTLSGAESSSTAGDIVSYRWNAAALALGTRNGPSATYDFDSPGRYTVLLTVVDAAGNEAAASVDIRIQGETPTAVIQSDRTSGNAPLTVNFDGTASGASDDTIGDYFWNFGDFGESRDTKPAHVFLAAGTYTVTLRVVTGGGVEATTTTEISVGAVNSSLQFDGGQFATLPLGGSQTLDAFTFEAWAKAGEGGTLASIGNGAVTISLSPTDNRLRLQIGGTSTDVSATNIGGSWRHFAVSYDAAAGAIIYLDGVPLGTAATNGSVTIDQVILGQGFRGNIAETRLWSVVRSAAEISAARSERVTGAITGLLGAWPLDEGSGQSLENALSRSAAVGSRGASVSSEASDPAWSSDSPALP
ncbi:MAG: PKD domain-containing protein [Phycisphaerales bacterium]|nr:PKD domain-containing protein [Phycisphaerales bacterium]